MFYIEEEHLSYHAIAEKLKIHRNTVRSIWTKYQETNSVQDRPRSGRKRKLSIKDEQKAVRAAKRGENAPAIARSMRNKVSVDTIQRSLKNSGLKYLKIQETEHLTGVQRANRLKYAQDMIDFNWKTALFTDEKTFWLGSGSHTLGKIPSIESTEKWQNTHLNFTFGLELVTICRPNSLFSKKILLQSFIARLFKAVSLKTSLFIHPARKQLSGSGSSFTEQRKPSSFSMN